jgi:hypothetical protein
VDWGTIGMVMVWTTMRMGMGKSSSDDHSNFFFFFFGLPILSVPQQCP